MQTPSSILNPQDLEQAKARERLKVIQALLGIGLAVLFFLVWIPGGASVALRNATGNDAGWGPRLLYVLAFTVISALLDFPAELYFGFHSERKFGLLKQAFLPWLFDSLKQTLVFGLILGVLVLGLYWIFSSFANVWFPLAAGLITVLFAVVLILQPRLARLRFKTTTLEHPELEARIAALFARAGVPLLKVSKWLFSEKTKQGNAALSPVGRSSEVLISDTLLETVPIEGIETVLAHELGHKVHQDIRKLVGLSWLQLLAMVSFAYLALGSWGRGFGLRGPSDIATLPLFLFVITLCSLVFSLLTNEVTRRAEYAADRYALELTGNINAFEQTFRIIARDNLADPDPPAWVEFWLHDHPSIEKRIRAAKTWGTNKGA